MSNRSEIQKVQSETPELIEAVWLPVDGNVSVNHWIKRGVALTCQNASYF